MKKKIILILSIASLVFLLQFDFSKSKEFEKLKEGDIILQTSQSAQCEAVRIATNSKFSHCGIIFIDNGKQYVYEAVQPVKITLLSDWVQHGEGNNYLVKRLKNSETVLSKIKIDKMKKYALSLLNKDYDLYFEWSDNKIYCSEYVWKIYKNGADLELCTLEKLKSFNLKDPKVKAILEERYGKNIPLNEDVVAPSQLAISPVLETIIDTY